MNRISLALTSAAVAAIAWASLSISPAEAASMKAQIYLVQAAIPAKLTEKALISFARSHANKMLRETDDKEVKTRKWKSDMVIVFTHPVNDMEFSVLFYDVQDGPRRFINDMAIMVNDRKQKTFIQKVTLPRPSFKPNRQIELVATVKREEVGRMRFNIVGQEIQRSGEVSFSDSER